ncbi:MAG: adenosine deaminase [Chloroflexi bacterium]|nr:adenosine deaminase [Chloroflexota bacterium]
MDLHRHLDGSVRLETVLDLGLKHNVPLPADTLEGLRPFVHVSGPQGGLLSYFEKFKWMTATLADYDACRRVAYENVEDAAREGIDYIELRFSPLFMAEPFSLDPLGVTEAVIDGVQAGLRDFDTTVSLIGILSRQYGERSWLELDTLLKYRDHLAALDLAGDEINFSGSLFVEQFKRARDAGLHITIHAGEAAGPAGIWQAIDELGAERIGHALTAYTDPALMDTMQQKGIGIECNLTSNLHTSLIPAYAAHPLKKFLEHGLLATINTDDPGISTVYLRHEYETAAPAAGLTPQQIRQAQHNALQTAFLSAEEKTALLEKKQ